MWDNLLKRSMRMMENNCHQKVMIKWSSIFENFWCTWRIRKLLILQVLNLLQKFKI